jgi:hypothetical protein
VRQAAAFELDRRRDKTAAYIVVPPGGSGNRPSRQPRYVVPRLVVEPPRGLAGGVGLAVRGLVTGHPGGSVVYHAVPAALGARKQLATAFEAAWHARVSPGPMLYTGSPEGAGILAEQRGDDPFAVTTQIRTLWR